jgi:hypothetical protein
MFMIEITGGLLAYCLRVTPSHGVSYETVKHDVHGSELELATVNLVTEAS